MYLNIVYHNLQKSAAQSCDHVNNFMKGGVTEIWLEYLIGLHCSLHCNATIENNINEGRNMENLNDWS